MSNGIEHKTTGVSPGSLQQGEGPFLNLVLSGRPLQAGAGVKRLAPAPGPAKSSNDQSSETIPRRICLLDPDRERLLAMRRVFSAMGCEVLCLSQVIGASNQIRSFQPEILILDINMPSLSGPQLVKVLRCNLPAMPVLVLYSDMDESSLAEVARLAGADDFLSKREPITLLASRVRYHLERGRRARSKPEKGAGPEKEK
jgi:CheY-like chemotaxis protein